MCGIEEEFDPCCCKVYLESECCFMAEWSIINIIFSLRQLQEKCKEQWMSLPVAFIDWQRALILYAGMVLPRFWKGYAIPQGSWALTSPYTKLQKAPFNMMVQTLIPSKSVEEWSRFAFLHLPSLESFLLFCWDMFWSCNWRCLSVYKVIWKYFQSTTAES